MKILDLFSGIGGFSLAFHRAGAETLAFCEIDNQARSVLARNFPGVEIIQDVKTITRETVSGTPDVIVGGFPCQDVSVAGRREGLAGERSGLWFEYLRVISVFKPRWVVIENVPGLLSSGGGRDFAVILQGLVECGYGVAWRILDAQYDRLAQRRRRVWIVAGLIAAGANPAEILFDAESGGGNPPARSEAREDVAGTLSARPSGGGGLGLGIDFECADRLQIAGAVSAKWAKGTGGPAGDEAYNLVCGTLAASGAGTSRPAGQCNEADFLITHSLTAGGHDASEGGTGRGTPIVPAYPDIAPTLTRNYRKQPDNSDTNAGPMLIPVIASPAGLSAKNPPAVAFTERTRGDGRNVETSDDLAFSLTDGSKGGNPHSGKIQDRAGVRRLMPVECERLQGFPDGWTAEGIDAAGRIVRISDSARYRMLGNAVPVPTVEWIARRIVGAR